MNNIVMCVYICFIYCFIKCDFIFNWIRSWWYIDLGIILGFVDIYFFIVMRKFFVIEVVWLL